MKFLLFFVVGAALSSAVFARPVSYPGGVTLMQTNEASVHGLHLHYSPTFRYSIGYKAEYWEKEDLQFHGLQFNYLVKRWNAPASQANLYFKSGVGQASVNEVRDIAAFSGIAMDWEDRRYFISYENRFFSAEGIDQLFTQKTRAGIAPYIGDYGDLHTWVMLQVDHEPEGDSPITVTPLLRFFKNEYLAEIGINDDGEGLFNLIVRF